MAISLEHTAYKFILEKANDLSPVLFNVIQALGPTGFPPKKFTSLHLALIKVIIGQQLSPNAAKSIWGSLERLDSSLSNQDMSSLFQECHISKIKSCGVSHQKARAILEVMDYFNCNPSSECVLKEFTHNERVSELTKIWGVGNWSVEMLSIFYFHDPDIWPTHDGALNKAISLISDTSKLNQPQIHFTPYCSMFALMMWRAMDEELLLS